MFINIIGDRIELTAVGSIEMDLLRRMADGVHVQASDFSKGYCSSIILVPKILPEGKCSG